MGPYRIISSDDHVVEPPDLWTTRALARFKDRAPRIVRMEDGGDWWVCDGRKGVPLATGAQAGRRFEEPEELSHIDRFDNVRAGAYIPEEHVKDLDIDGVDVSITYPTVGLALYSVPDSELLTSIFSTYNNWLAEFCGTCPQRLKGIAMINLDDVGAGVEEMERCTRLGLSGAMISLYPVEERPYSLPEYDPLWAAAQDLEMPISLHIGTNRPGPGQEVADVMSVTPPFHTNVDHWVRMSLSHIIFSGVFERFPKLQVGSIEMELSWAPHFLDRMDFTYTQRAAGDTWHRFKEDMLPSDYFHRNVFLSFQEDALGIKMREFIGVDKLLWGSDYPHQESTFPKSRQIIEEILADCTEEEKAKIVGGNAARVYHLD